MKKLLIIVDMINGFINECNLHDKGIRRIIPNCVEYVQSYLTQKHDVIAFVDSHNINSQEFEAYPVHCLAGTSESELVVELSEYVDRIKIIKKNSTNGIHAEGFKELLVNIDQYQSIMIVGCCSDICVLQLALSLKTYYNQHDIVGEIIVDKSACETFDTTDHPRSKYNDIAFELLLNSGVKIIRGRADE